MIPPTLPSESLFRLSFALRPKAHERPQVTKNGVFYSQRYQNWIRAFRAIVRTQWIHPPLTGEVAVTLELRRVACDVDNATKAVLDGLQGIVYENDRQVVDIHARWIERYEEGSLSTIEVATLCRPEVDARRERARRKPVRHVREGTKGQSDHVSNGPVQPELVLLEGEKGQVA